MVSVSDVGGPSTGIKTDTQTVDVGDRVEFECIVTGNITYMRCILPVKKRLIFANQIKK